MDDRPATERDDAREGAVFEPVPLRATGRPPILLAVLLAVIGGAVALGMAGRPSESPAPAPLQGAAAAAPSPLAVKKAPAARTPRPRGSPPSAAVKLLQLDLRPDERHLFVHGDVFSLDAFIVVVSLEDRGTVTASRTVSMPGGSTAFLTGANPRFDVLFDLPPDAAPGSIWIRANTYDSHGDLVASVREPMRPESAAVMVGLSGRSGFGLFAGDGETFAAGR
jgi:hypothetical protein